jgi:RimJ/RimL family protein N-acetyltransferase
MRKWRTVLVTYSQLSERIRGQRSDSRSLMFMVEIREDGGWKSIGACHFRDFDAVSRSVVIGFSIGEKSYWGKGYGSQALRVFVDLLFQRYNLHRIQLDTFEENRRAIRCYEKCGFVREGVLRQAFWTIHGYRDKIVMGLLREDWEKIGLDSKKDHDGKSGCRRLVKQLRTGIGHPDLSSTGWGRAHIRTVNNIRYQRSSTTAYIGGVIGE